VRLVVLDGRFVRSLRHGVDVSWRAKEGEREVGALLGKFADDGIARQGELDVKGSVQVAVVGEMNVRSNASSAP